MRRTLTITTVSVLMLSATGLLAAATPASALLRWATPAPGAAAMAPLSAHPAPGRSPLSVTATRPVDETRSAKGKPPAKVKSGSSWTLVFGPVCEVDSFGAHKAFSATSGGAGDEGTYRGKKKLTMTFTGGPDDGGVFTGTWARATGVYSGSFSQSESTVEASLSPATGAGCVTVTTKPAANDIEFDQSDSDTATVTGEGGVTPTGTVHFYVCASKNGVACSPTAAGAVDLGSTSLVGSGGSGDGATATSAAYDPPAIGDYCFVGVYSGDGHYAAGSDGSVPGECFSDSSRLPTLSTTPSQPTLPEGGTETDTATVTGDGTTAPTGSVAFYVCPAASGPCPATGGGAGEDYLGSVAVSAGSSPATVVATSDPNYEPPATGTYCFAAAYSGDDHYDAVTDDSGDECFDVVTEDTVTVTTAPSTTSIHVGQGVTDTATVTGHAGATPTGTVAFYVCPETSVTLVACTVAGGTAVGSAVTVVGQGSTARATSAAYAPASTGTYCFLGVYSGDETYASGSDGSTADECFTVTTNTL